MGRCGTPWSDCLGVEGEEEGWDGRDGDGSEPGGAGGMEEMREKERRKPGGSNVIGWELV